MLESPLAAWSLETNRSCTLQGPERLSSPFLCADISLHLGLACCQRPQMAGRLDPHPVATLASNVSNEVGSSTLSTATGMVALWSHGVASDPTPVTFSRGRGVNVVLWPKGSDLLLKSPSVSLPIKLILDPRSRSMDDLPSGSLVGDLLGSLMCASSM